MNHRRNFLFFFVSIVLIITIFVACLSKKGKQQDGKTGSSTTPLKQPLNDTFKVRALTDIKFEPTAQRLKQGEYLANSILQCFTCHSPRNWDVPGAPPIAEKQGSGGTILQEDSTTLIIAPNITPDKQTGAGTWTDDMLGRAIREGVGHDGRALNWQMPYSTYRSLSDEDLAAVVVYIRSLAPVYNVVRSVKMVAEEKSGIERSLMPITEPVATPDQSDPIKRGSYLVKIGECVGCHTSHAEYNPGLFAGGNDIGRFARKAFSANITPDASGIPYGTQSFIFTMRTGKGGTLSPIMPWVAYKNLSDDDLEAIYTYLGTFPKFKHYINNQAPATLCAICGMTHGFGSKNKREKPTGIKLDTALLSQYTGSYFNELYKFSYVILKEGNKLLLQPWENGPKVELIPQSDLRFLAPGWVLPINFIKDKDGHITALAEESDFGSVCKKIK